MAVHACYRIPPKIVPPPLWTEQFLSRRTIIDKISFFVQFHSSTHRFHEERGNEERMESTTRGMGSAWIEPERRIPRICRRHRGRHPRRETFPKGPIKTRCWGPRLFSHDTLESASADEKKIGQSIRYRRFEREVGESLSRRSVENYFFIENMRREIFDRQHLRIDDTRWHCLWNRWIETVNNRCSPLIFPRCERCISF